MTTDTPGRSFSKRTSSKTRRRKPVKPEAIESRQGITPVESARGKGQLEESRPEETAPGPRSRLDAFAAGEMERPRPAAPIAAVPAVELKPAYLPEIEPEGVELSEEELFALLPPLHLIEILDAVAEREMSEEVLEAIVGKPLAEVAEEEVPDLLRTIAIWDPDLAF